jgi:arsenite methyltransferase
MTVISSAVAAIRRVPSAPLLRPQRFVSLDLDSPELAASYDQLSVRQFNHGKVLIGSLRVKAGERVLELGGAGERLRAHVERIVSRAGGEAVRIDARALQAASGPRALSELASASFDVVYLNGVLQRVRDRPTLLREAQRVLKSGGRIGVNGADAQRLHQGAALVRQAAREEGLSDAAFAHALAQDARVDAHELTRLLCAAGFVQIQVAAHTFVDAISGVDELFAWRSCSAAPSDRHLELELDSQQRASLRARLARNLEALRAPAGIRLERYLVFATAHKP